MKSILIVVLFLGTLQAQAAGDSSMSTTAHRSSVKISQTRFGLNADPIWLVMGGLGLKFEYFATDRVSLGLGGMDIPGYRVRKNSDSDPDSMNYTLQHSEIYLGSNIMLTGSLGRSGAYLNPALGYMQTRVSDFEDTGWSGELSSPMLRLTAGYQWILVDHLRLAAGGGLNLTSGGDVIVKDDTGKEVLRENSGNLGGLAIDLQIGYVF